jgi:hypothetical protein
MKIGTFRTIATNVMFSSYISNVCLGPEDPYKLIFIVIYVSLHYVHAWSQQSLKSFHIKDCWIKTRPKTKTHNLSCYIHLCQLQYYTRPEWCHAIVVILHSNTQLQIGSFLVAVFCYYEELRELLHSRRIIGTIMNIFCMLLVCSTFKKSIFTYSKL